jgi:hypothetical protein
MSAGVSRLTCVLLPLRATVGVGFTFAFVVITTLDERLPDAVGRKVTDIVQEPAGARPAPAIGQVEFSRKSAVLPPKTATLLIVKVTFPVFVSVTVCPALEVFTT